MPRICRYTSTCIAENWHIDPTNFTPNLPSPPNDNHPAAGPPRLPRKHLILRGTLALVQQSLAILVPDGEQGDNDAHAACHKSEQVGVPVAGDADGAEALAVGADNRVAVKHGAVDEVEGISRDGRGQGHGTPVLAESVDAERLGGDGRENAKQEAVTKAG
jgi:hypothetical protein